MAIAESELDIEKEFSVKDDTGEIALRIGFMCSLYFQNAHTQEIREAALSCLDRYRQMCGEHLRWATHPKSYRWQAMGDEQQQDEWILLKEPNDSWQISYQGGTSPKEASNFRFEILGARGWKNETTASYLHFCLPMTFFADRTERLPELVTFISGQLRAVHGYAGFGVIESYDSALRRRHEPTVFGLTQRFPGLEVDYPISHSIYALNGIKCVNWLTILGDRWLDKIGGLASLRTQLGEGYEYQRYNDGIVVQCGKRPQIGDRNRNIWPESYIRLAQLLRPIRFRDHRSFHESGTDDRFSLESTAAWLERFDSMSSINQTPSQ